MPITKLIRQEVVLKLRKITTGRAVAFAVANARQKHVQGTCIVYHSPVVQLDSSLRLKLKMMERKGH